MNMWRVPSILTKRGTGRGVRYLVRWRGYPPSEDTWETRNTLEETEALDIFEAEQQEKANQARKGRNLRQRTWIPFKQSHLQERKTQPATKDKNRKTRTPTNWNLRNKNKKGTLACTEPHMAQKNKLTAKSETFHLPAWKF